MKAWDEGEPPRDQTRPGARGDPPQEQGEPHRTRGCPRRAWPGPRRLRAGMGPHPPNNNPRPRYRRARGAALGARGSPHAPSPLTMGPGRGPDREPGGSAGAAPPPPLAFGAAWGLSSRSPRQYAPTGGSAGVRGAAGPAPGRYSRAERSDADGCRAPPGRSPLPLPGRSLRQHGGAAGPRPRCTTGRRGRSSAAGTGRDGPGRAGTGRIGSGWTGPDPI